MEFKTAQRQLTDQLATLLCLSLFNEKFSKMKRLIIASACLLLLGPVTAQPQFQKTDYSKIGDRDSLEYIFSQTFNIDLDTFKGQNYTWDFSTIINPGVAASWRTSIAYDQPVHPLAINYPDAELQAAYRSIDGDELKFYDWQGDSLWLLREGTVQDGLEFSSPHLIANFPISLNQKQFSLNPIDTGSGPYGTRSYQVNYDGFGDLITPFGVHSDVLRLSITQRDSLFSSRIRGLY